MWNRLLSTRALLSILLTAVSTLASEDSNCYKVEYGTNDFIEYQVGDVGSNIILASPHGGFLKPKSIPDRGPTGCYMPKTDDCLYSLGVCESKSSNTCKTITTRQDEFTRNLTLILADEFKSLTGQRPHVILNNLHRSKLDANRPLDQASFWNYEASVAWHEFSIFILKAKQSLKVPAMFFDIHRQRHRENWVELGYRIQTRDLVSGNYTANDSSIVSLAKKYQSTEFLQLVSGNLSLGYYLQDEGYKTTPSPDYPLPNFGGYFRGGYNTWVYGSQIGGDIDAIQIESPLILMNEAKGVPYGKSLAKAVNRFMKRHYAVYKGQASQRQMCEATGGSTALFPALFGMVPIFINYLW